MSQINPKAELMSSGIKRYRPSTARPRDRAVKGYKFDSQIGNGVIPKLAACEARQELEDVAVRM